MNALFNDALEPRECAGYVGGKYRTGHGAAVAHGLEELDRNPAVHGEGAGFAVEFYEHG